MSLGNTTALEQGTLADRHYENGFAERALRAHPIVGIGWAPYGAEVLEPDGQRQQRSFIHNQYLGVWLRAGLLGLAALLMVLLRSFLLSLRAFRREADWIAAGTAAAIAGIAASSAVGIYVQEEASALTLMALAALAVVVSSRDSRFQLESRWAVDPRAGEMP